MASDIYFTVENGKLIYNVENDGWAYVTKGAERQTAVVTLEDAKKMGREVQALKAIEDYEKKTGRRYQES